MIAEKLAEYAYNLKFSDLSAETVHQAKKHFIDALGTGIAARNAPPIAIIKKTFASEKNSARMNAFLYGAMIRYLDYDDWYAAKSREPAHPNDNFGGVLAVAEYMKSSPKEFLTAAVLGYEVQCRLCDAGNLRTHGWDHVIYGAISQALAVGKLMKLNKAQLTQVINLNLSTNITSRQVREASELSMWKAGAFSNVARNAVFFAQLAKNGMTGPSEIFEGKYGLKNMLTCAGLKICKFPLDVKAFGKQKSHFAIMDCWMKNWPAEIHSQSAIQAAMELRADIPKLADIKSIHVDTHEAGYTIIGSGAEKWKPKTKETADHSIPYLVGAALKYGYIDQRVFAKKVLNNKEVLATVAKVTVKEDKALTKLYPWAAANRVTITLNNGTVLKKEVKYHKGHYKNKMNDEDVEAKFKMLTTKHISQVKQKAILTNTWKLEKQKSFDWGILGKA